MKNPRHGYKTVSVKGLIRLTSWKEGTKTSIKETLDDPLLSALLRRSNLTKAQFETLLIDQLGDDMANKRLTRDEMAQLLRNPLGISRGALNRTLRQARTNISGAIHTVLLLGYSGLLESPSLGPFVEASERLKSQTSQLRETAGNDWELYVRISQSIMQDLEEAFQALYGKKRDA